eukprot:scaffold3269_cov112-Skeletonema_dohrnii-CCMP3373.AAC.4
MKEGRECDMYKYSGPPKLPALVLPVHVLPVPGKEKEKKREKERVLTILLVTLDDTYSDEPSYLLILSTFDFGADHTVQRSDCSATQR